MTMSIRLAAPADEAAIWEIFHEVVAAGDTYAFDPATTRAALPSLWLAAHMHTYVAETERGVAGTYVVKANQSGLGDHVANAAYMVHPDARGRGLGAAMCEHSKATARALGYRAMQFNLVVSSNYDAIRLWQRAGFAIVGTIPRAFRHRQLGEVDAHVMYLALTDPNDVEAVGPHG